VKHSAVHDVHNCFIHQTWQNIEDHFGRETIVAKARNAKSNDRYGVLYLSKGSLKMLLVYVKWYPKVEHVTVRRVQLDVLEVVQLGNARYLHLINVGLVRDLLEHDFGPHALELIFLHEKRITKDDVFGGDVEFCYATDESFAQLELNGQLLFGDVVVVVNSFNLKQFF
jgi:hypothetical protein